MRNAVTSMEEAFFLLVYIQIWHAMNKIDLIYE